MPVENIRDNRRTSEYASVLPRSLIKDGGEGGHPGDSEVTISNPMTKDATSAAILKITEKYDSLGSLRASLERLDVNELDDDDVDVQKIPLDEEEDDDGGIGHDDDDDQGHKVSTGHSYNRTDSVDVSEQDLHQVETFFRSHKTVVNVCPTLANLYFSTSSRSGSDVTDGAWQLAYTGIPVLLLDSGETRSRTKRRIQIVLSEKGTGFLLWKDTIDNLSNYRASDAHFHTMYLSADHRRMVGISFDNASAARDFYERIETLTSDPANISLSGPSSKAAKKAAAKQKKKREKEKIKLPHKTDISQPCCFQHVTRVELNDKEQFVTLSTLTGSRKKSVDSQLENRKSMNGVESA